MAQAQALTEDIERVAKWEAWCGDRDALRRMCGAIETFAASSLARELATVEAGDENEKYGGRYAANLRWQVTARATEPEYNRTRQGSPEEVIAALDEKTVESFSCELSAFGEPHLSIVARMHRRFGPSIRVSGSDPAQVHSVFTEIEAAVRRGVPKWRVLRKTGALFVYATVLALLLFLAVYPHTTAIRTPTMENRLLVSVLIALSGGLLLGGAVAFIVARLFPGFEVTAPGGEGAGSRIRWFLLALVAGAVISVFVSRL